MFSFEIEWIFFFQDFDYFAEVFPIVHVSFDEHRVYYFRKCRVDELKIARENIAIDFLELQGISLLKKSF